MSLQHKIITTVETHNTLKKIPTNLDITRVLS